MDITCFKDNKGYWNQEHRRLHSERRRSVNKYMYQLPVEV
jgi:hypothetical protein